MSLERYLDRMDALISDLKAQRELRRSRNDRMVENMPPAVWLQLVGNLEEAVARREPIRIGEGVDECRYRWDEGEQGYVVELGPRP